MAEYIDRELLKFKIRKLFPSLEDRCRINEIVNSIPAVDIVPIDFHNRCMEIEIRKRFDLERNTGKWIHDTPDIVECSECGLKDVWYEEDGMGCALYGRKYANFCPNCGAAMEENE